jgi:hypothetical protein
LPRISLEPDHVVSVNVDDTTYFVMSFIFAPKSPVDCRLPGLSGKAFVGLASK